MLDRLKELAQKVAAAMDGALASRHASVAVPLLLLPPLMYTCFVRTWAGRAVMAAIVITAAIGSRLHFQGLADGLEADGIDGGPYEALGHALFVSALAVPLAGMMLGSAWRSSTPRHATLLAGAAIVVAALSALPFHALLADLEAKTARAEASAEAYAIIWQATDVIDAEKSAHEAAAELRREATKFMLESAGIDPQRHTSPGFDATRSRDLTD